jgi:hypothetical protein
MLRADVVEAVREGRFAVYAVSHVDEGIEILTGIAADNRDGSGEFPAGSINARVEGRLIGFSERLRALRAKEAKDRPGGNDGGAA